MPANKTAEAVSVFARFLVADGDAGAKRSTQNLELQPFNRYAVSLSVTISFCALREMALKVVVPYPS
jgi:hypothetical protein